MGLGMLPADEQQGGQKFEESGGQHQMTTSSSKTMMKKEIDDPFASPFGAGEDKARARGYHQQSTKEAQMDKTTKSAPAAKSATTTNKTAPTVSSAKLAPVPTPLDETAPITRTTLIMDIVYKYPEAVEVLVAAGLHCVGCQLSVYDDFQTGCSIHGFDEETIDRLVVEMNNSVKKAQMGVKTQAPEPMTKTVKTEPSAKTGKTKKADCC
jgi:hydroxylamine reductase